MEGGGGLLQKVMLSMAPGHEEGVALHWACSRECQAVEESVQRPWGRRAGRRRWVLLQVSW